MGSITHSGSVGVDPLAPDSSPSTVLGEGPQYRFADELLYRPVGLGDQVVATLAPHDEILASAEVLQGEGASLPDDLPGMLMPLADLRRIERALNGSHAG
jgi:hypothetical protein